MRPDIAIFHQHVSEANFQLGVDSGRWGLAEQTDTYPNWPHVIAWIHAMPKAGKPEIYYFKFNLDNYPSHAPTACPWDPNTGNSLAQQIWPRGSKFVNNTFNYNWNPEALYTPCDRIAMIGHDAWREQFPELWWQPHFKITVYLNFLHRLLNSSDYVKS